MRNNHALALRAPVGRFRDEQGSSDGANALYPDLGANGRSGKRRLHYQGGGKETSCRHLGKRLQSVNIRAKCVARYAGEGFYFEHAFWGNDVPLQDRRGRQTQMARQCAGATGFVYGELECSGGVKVRFHEAI